MLVYLNHSPSLWSNVPIIGRLPPVFRSSKITGASKILLSSPGVFPEYKTCHCCLYHIRDFRRIRRYISLSVVKTISAAVIAIPCFTIRKQGSSKTSTCTHVFGKGSHVFSSLFLLSAASEIIALARCTLSHYFLDLYSSLSRPLINTTSIFEFHARSIKKF